MNALLTRISNNDIEIYFSEVLLERPLCWRSLFFQFFGGWRKNKIAR